ncbi:MAG: GAF domain-containing sensor histidine kinase [Armatimonadetes bacterium]|nr:GAF domain-containing sensor histidine kinase [Armatimonadota bacterium]
MEDRAAHDRTRELQARFERLEYRRRDLERQNRELSIMNAIAAVASRTLDLETVLKDTLSQVIQAVEAGGGSIALVDESTGDLIPLVYQGSLPALPIRGEWDGQARLPRWEDEPEGEAHRSFASIPLQAQDRVLGVMSIASEPGAAFSAEDIQLLTTISHQIGVAIENARLYEETRRRVEEIESIHRVGLAVTSSLDLAEVLSLIWEQVSRLMSAQTFYIALCDEAEQKLHFALLVEDGEMREGGYSVSLSHKDSLSTWVARSREPVLIRDWQEDRSESPVKGIQSASPNGSCSRSLLIIPLVAKGRTIGVVSVQNSRPNAFDEGDLRVLTTIGGQAAIAIENARLFEQERRRSMQLELISEIGKEATVTFDIQRLLDTITHTIQTRFNYFSVSLYLKEDATGQLMLRSAAGAYKERLEAEPLRVDPGVGMIGQTAKTGQTFLSNDVSREPQYIALDFQQTRSEMCVPIKIERKVVGILNVESDRANAFDDWDVKALETLGDQLARTLDNVRLYDRTRDMAIMEERHRLARELHDTVTQLVFSMVLNAEAASTLLDRDPGQARGQIHRLQETAHDALREMRSLILELHPASLEKDGLAATLERHIGTVRKNSGLDIRLSVEGYQRQPVEIEQSLYRIAQEALHNVLKHACAETVQVALDYTGDAIRLSIRDDGAGFDPDALGPSVKNMGLTTMHERAELVHGTLHIEAAPGRGTEITAQVPKGEISSG